MAKKQKSFAEKASGKGGVDTVWVKYVKSIKSEQTGKYRFNEQMIGLQGGETLDVALKRLDEASNLVDIDLSEFIAQQAEETVEEPVAEEAASEDVSTEEVVEDSTDDNSQDSESEEVDDPEDESPKESQDEDK